MGQQNWVHFGDSWWNHWTGQRLEIPLLVLQKWGRWEADSHPHRLHRVTVSVLKMWHIVICCVQERFYCRTLWSCSPVESLSSSWRCRWVRWLVRVESPAGKKYVLCLKVLPVTVKYLTHRTMFHRRMFFCHLRVRLRQPSACSLYHYVLHRYPGLGLPLPLQFIPNYAALGKL